MLDYSALALHQSSPKKVIKNSATIVDSFTIGAVGSLKSQLIEQHRSSHMPPSDYMVQNFNERMQSLNVPSRNELQNTMGKVSTGVFPAQKLQYETLQNFQF